MYILGAKLQSENKIKKISVKKKQTEHFFYYLFSLSILNVPCACCLGYEFVGRRTFAIILQVPDALGSTKVIANGTLSFKALAVMLP